MNNICFFFYILNTLAVVTLSSLTLNLQSFKQKNAEFLAIILGINLTFVQAAVPPY